MVVSGTPLTMYLKSSGMTRPSQNGDGCKGLCRLPWRWFTLDATTSTELQFFWAKEPAV